MNRSEVSGTRRVKLIGPAWIVFAVAVILSLLALVAVRATMGQSLGLRSTLSTLIRTPKNILFSILDSSRVSSYNRGQFTNIIFLHRSVGANLIEQGGLRQKFAAAGFAFSDHGYNSEGLAGPDGRPTGYGYNLPGDNTDPDGLAQIFAEPVFPLPINTFSALLQYEVIVVKSCFPNSNIESDEQFAKFQGYYLSLRSRVDEHPDKIFVLLTTPPLNPAETSAAAAARARAMSQWLRSDQYLRGHPNLFTFDLFDTLAERDPAAPDFNQLSKTFREGTDSHPNQIANQMVAPLVVDFVSRSAQSYRAQRSTVGR